MHLDEFRFLAGDARRVHRLAPLPRMRRVARTTREGKTISALTTSDHIANLDTTFVFLHGAGLNAHTFDPTILALGENAVSIDLPGHGRSDWRMDARYTPDAMATDVAEAMVSLTSGPIHLVGHSLGGLTAIAASVQLAEQVQHLTLIDVTPGISLANEASSVSSFISGQRDFASIEEMVDRAVSFGIGADRDALRRGVELNARQRSDGRFEWSHHFAHLDGLGVVGEDAEHPFNHLWDPLSRFGESASLIRGSQGFVTDRMQSEWRNRLQHSEMYTIEGGHNLHEHAPRELAHTLRRIAGGRY